jgi:hypothetical protein
VMLRPRNLKHHGSLLPCLALRSLRISTYPGEHLKPRNAPSEALERHL